jgi:hypothetical protein
MTAKRHSGQGRSRPEASLPADGVPSFVPEWWKNGSPSRTRTCDHSINSRATQGLSAASIVSRLAADQGSCGPGIWTYPSDRVAPLIHFDRCSHHHGPRQEWLRRGRLSNSVRSISANEEIKGDPLPRSGRTFRSSPPHPTPRGPETRRRCSRPRQARARRRVRRPPALLAAALRP